MPPLAVLVACFFVYSSAGWLFECVYCSIKERHFINRGFLNGPWCPIYGAGGIAVALVLGDVDSPVLLFLAGAALCCTLEYATSYVMELRYHARWWDYSGRLLNINGRVCLAGATLFGTGSVAVVDVAQPWLEGTLALLPETVLGTADGLLVTVFVVDVVVTNLGLSGFRNKVDDVCDQLTLRAREMHLELLEGDSLLSQGFRLARGSLVGRAYDQVRSLGSPSELLEPVLDAFRATLNRQEERVLEAFPRMSVVPERIRSAVRRLEGRGAGRD